MLIFYGLLLNDSPLSLLLLLQWLFLPLTAESFLAAMATTYTATTAGATSGLQQRCTDVAGRLCHYHHHSWSMLDLNQCYCHGNEALIVVFVVIIFVGLEVGAGIEQLWLILLLLLLQIATAILLDTFLLGACALSLSLCLYWFVVTLAISLVLAPIFRSIKVLLHGAVTLSHSPYS